MDERRIERRALATEDDLGHDFVCAVPERMARSVASFLEPQPGQSISIVIE